MRLVVAAACLLFGNAVGFQLAYTPSSLRLSRPATPFALEAATVAAGGLHKLRGGHGAVFMALGKDDTYDYIICGGGIGGCVLANRLTESGRNKVLLLEAGKLSDKNLLVSIPAGVIKLFKSAIDWQYQSVPDPTLDGKEVYLIRGKTLGGSSALNVMLVHRGTPGDYEGWVKAGAEGWGPDDVLPYFKKAEDFRSSGSGDPQFHGRDGNYPVDDVRYQNPLSKRFLEACAALGWKFKHDFNDWSQDQVGYGRFKVAQANGKRVTAAAGYLTRDVRKRPNLTIATQAQATKVLFEGGDKAVGVEFVDKGGKRRVAKSSTNGEVILTGGVINSPQLLMLSGVGPADHLRSVGVTPVVDRPGVGANLQDHPAVVVAHDITKPVSLTDDLFIKGTSIMKPKNFLNWLIKGSGPLTSPGCDHGAFVKSDASDSEADLQLRFVPGRGTNADGVRSYIEIGAKGQPQPGVTVQIVGIRAKSKGRVLLQSNDPLAYPKIETKYLSESRDLETLRNGISIAREIVKQSAFADTLGPEVFPGADKTSKEDLDAYIRESLHTANALVGTCRIGRPDDREAVVDPHLRVIGTKNLRVVDASVMPAIPGGQTGAPTTMIAEKAADLIRAAARDLVEEESLRLAVQTA